MISELKMLNSIYFPSVSKNVNTIIEERGLDVLAKDKKKDEQYYLGLLSDKKKQEDKELSVAEIEVKLKKLRK